MKSIAIIGNSIAANMCAAYLRKKFPKLEITLIGPSENKHPIVGESLTEFSTLFLHKLGYADYLEEDHFHKYGLTFHFKQDINNPNDRTYSTHEAPAIPPMPSNQINRFTLDEKLRQDNKKAGVSFINGKVSAVSINKGTPHVLSIKAEDKQSTSLSCDWLIDASGRNRVLSKHFGIQKKSKYQRSTFWFRLANFDKESFFNFDSVKNPQHCYDSFYATHHFFGKANWIWCIPLKCPEHERLISVGIVWRPELTDYSIKNIDDFLEQMSKEHPSLKEFVESGDVLDTNIYRSYMHESKQLYSENRWAIVGDAGDSVDPLYSTGMVMNSLQSEQIATLIEKDLNNNLDQQTVKTLEKAYKTTRNMMQNEISSMFEVTHDPYQSHWRMHLSSAVYFYWMLPMWLSGYLCKTNTSKWISRALMDSQVSLASFKKLLAVASKKLGPLPSEKLSNKYNLTVNWELWQENEKDVGRYLSKLLRMSAIFRLKVLKDAGWYRAHHHLFVILSDLSKSIAIRFLTLRTPFSKSLVAANFSNKKSVKKKPNTKVSFDNIALER